MDCNCGRLFSSNSPPKSLKLLSPIWMDSNQLQFNMWNDFDLLHLLIASLRLSFHSSWLTWVNELFPIFNLFNRFNLSISNVCTDLKQLFPISIDSTCLNCEKSSIACSTIEEKPGTAMELSDESIDWRKLVRETLESWGWDRLLLSIVIRSNMNSNTLYSGIIHIIE